MFHRDVVRVQPRVYGDSAVEAFNRVSASNVKESVSGECVSVIFALCKLSRLKSPESV